MTTPEEEMRSLVDGLNLPEADSDTNVSLLSEAELLKRYTQTTRELMKRSEVLQPNTQTGRDLHSTRSAYLIEMKRRGMRR